MRSRSERWLLLLSLLVTLVAYWPLTRVYFISDDFVDMVQIANRGNFHFFVSPFGGHMIFTRNVEVLLMNALFGLRHPEAYGTLALVTHLVNVSLLFRTTRRFTGSAALASLSGAVWGTCQILSDAVGWFSVFGHVLCGTFVLLWLSDAAAQDETGAPLEHRTVLKWAIFIAFGATCFGVGIAIAMAFPVMMFVWFDRTRLDRRGLIIAALVPVFVYGLYVGWHKAYALYDALPLDEQQLQRRALSDLVPPVRMLGYLLAVSVTSLVRGYAFRAVEYPSIAWWLVGAYWVAIWSAFVGSETRDRRRFLALGLAAVAPYGIIAVGRANVYGMFGIGPLEAARQLRYHYVGSIPLVLLPMLAIARAARSRWLTELPGVALGTWVLSNVCFYAGCDWKLRTHDDCREYVGQVIADIDARVDAAPVGSDVFIPNTPLPKYCTVFMGYDTIPGPAAIYLLLHPEDDLRGRRVHFVEEENVQGLFDNPRNTRLSRLMVPP